LPPLPDPIVPPLVPPGTSPTTAPPGPAHRHPDHLAPGRAAHAAPDDDRVTGAHPVVPPPYSTPVYASASVPVPVPRPAPDVAPPGSRGDWPLTNSDYQPARPPAQDQFDGSGYALTSLPPTVLGPGGVPAQAPPPPPPPAPAPDPWDGRVAPPWQDESLSGEPPTLNISEISEPDPLDDFPLRGEPDPLLAGDSPRYDRGDDGMRFDAPYNPPPLRLVEPDSGRIDTMSTGEPMGVGEENDGDLLIFAEARSAWFTGHVEQQDTDLDWNNPADLGWQAAERAAEPILGEETSAGLPRRVPQANLVPGSALPPADDRSLRIVRDPAAMAAHTTGYFRGSRRGEEVRGFAVGGRPGRESAAGWDFSRDSWEGDRDEGYEYRSAARQ
jgi:hypothetical protein